jgi:hypothetical protein
LGKQREFNGIRDYVVVKFGEVRLEEVWVVRLRDNTELGVSSDTKWEEITDSFVLNVLCVFKEEDKI